MNKTLRKNLTEEIKELYTENYKTSISVLLTIPKPLTVWITINCGKFFKRWEGAAKMAEE